MSNSVVVSFILFLLESVEWSAAAREVLVDGVGAAGVTRCATEAPGAVEPTVERDAGVAELGAVLLRTRV